MSNHTVLLPEEIINEIVDNADAVSTIRGFKSRDKLAALLTNSLLDGSSGIISYLRQYVSDDLEYLRKLRILDVGSGFCTALCVALKEGLNVIGIEPRDSGCADGRYDMALRIMEANGIERPESKLINGTAERMPFDDESFDVVISVTVLEHVNNIDDSMNEMIRVLKPNGTLIAHVPNYNSFYEGHYDIRWIPYMNKPIAKFYVKTVFNRDSSFIDTYQFTTPSHFSKYLKAKGMSGRLVLHNIGVIGRILYYYDTVVMGNKYGGNTITNVRPNLLGNIHVKKDSKWISRNYSRLPVLIFRKMSELTKNQVGWAWSKFRRFPMLVFIETLKILGLVRSLTIVLRKTDGHTLKNN